MGVDFRYAISYSQKEKHFSCLGCIAKVRGIKCSKKEIQVRQQENLLRIRVMDTGAKLQNYLIRAI